LPPIHGEKRADAIYQTLSDLHILTQDLRGLASAGAAFLIWGLSPLFWKMLVRVPAGQLLAHRVLWAAVILVVLLGLKRRLSEITTLFNDRATLLVLALTTALISSNWLIYIWAIVTDRIIQASLGYYINPLVTVLLGMLILKERLTRAQWLSFGLAAAGVGSMIWQQREVPWIALSLALSFGFYSLLRKQVRAQAVAGLAIETCILAPVALAYLAGAELTSTGAFGRLGSGTNLLLLSSGLVTALPLLLFTYGARRLTLTTVGFLQYSAPTLQLLLAVFLYREPFTTLHLAAFVLIWVALVIFSWDLALQRSRVPATRDPGTPSAAPTDSL
jgi:chloramphenicol-sensitive protein RarD